MNEIEEVINVRQLSEQSKKTYRNLYSKMNNILGDIKNKNEKDILLVINDLSNEKVSNKLSYLNIAILIKQFNNEDLNNLLIERDRLIKIRDKEQSKIKIDLPEYNEVKKYVDSLSGVKYIVNFLILNYGVRNKDVNVFITNDVKLTKDKNINYLLVKDKSIEWIRNDYKTSSIYGIKKHIIKNKKFIEEVKKQSLNIWLLSGREEGIAESGLNNIVSRMLYKYNDKNMNEASYFKLNVKYLQTKPKSFSKISKLGEIRGTGSDTIEKYYNETVA